MYICNVNKYIINIKTLPECDSNPRPFKCSRRQTNQATPVSPFPQCSDLISAIAFVSRHNYHNQSLAQVITWVKQNELMHMVSTHEDMKELYKVDLSVIGAPDQWVLFRRSYQLSYQAMNLRRSQDQHMYILCNIYIYIYILFVNKVYIVYIVYI